MTSNYLEVKKAYIDLYGEFYDDEEFDSFETAFRCAWDAVDFLDSDPKVAAESLSESSSLAQK